MSNFSIPTANQTYRIYNMGGSYSAKGYLMGSNGGQAGVGNGPGNDGQWFWFFDIISSNTEEKSFIAWVRDSRWNHYLSTLSEDGDNRVMCYGYSDTDRKHWKFVWNNELQKYRVINMSRENVGVGTKYLGSNATSYDVFVGGDLTNKDYTWEFYAENDPTE